MEGQAWLHRGTPFYALSPMPVPFRGCNRLSAFAPSSGRFLGPVAGSRTRAVFAACVLSRRFWPTARRDRSGPGHLAHPVSHRGWSCLRCTLKSVA